MRRLVVLTLFVAACSADVDSTTDAGGPADGGLEPDATVADASNDESCGLLFGAPNDKTGLGPDECAPSCTCGAGYEAPTFSSEQLDWMRTIAIDEPFSEVSQDPYEEAAPSSEGVCGIIVVQESYRLQTFDDLEAMAAAGAHLTHWGDCGVCSTLENFAVYAATGDLTEPVRRCGLQNGTDFDGNVACLQELGFDLPCAQIWAYNTRHTRENCLEPCLQNLNKPYNLPDGGLNPCLACDEELSGPVFKAVAGRTRRNSGLASALCRPCSDVRPVTHDYLP